MLILTLLTLGVMGATAYALWREGLLTAVTTLVNVVIAGLVAFNFFEPLAGQLETMFGTSFLKGYEDCIALVLIFAFMLGGLRVIVNSLANSEPDYPALFAQISKVICSLVAGYLVAGVLSCAFITMPWPQGKVFGDFDPQTEERNTYLPPDQVWLAMMHWSGSKTFVRERHPTFDAQGNFELRYHRYRHFKSGKDDVTKPDNLLRP